MHRFPCLEGFHAGGPIHGVMLVLVLAFVVIFTRDRGSGDRPSSVDMDRRFSAVLFSLCIIAFLYFLRPSQIGWDHSLPLHICNISGVAAAIAIRTGNRTARNVLHFWGLVLGSQALLFPAVQAGPAHVDFWLYWVNHAATIAAAIYDVRVRGYRASWHDWRVATLLAAAYVMIMAPFDQWMHVDYGFLGHTELAETMVHQFGPWPLRVPVLWLATVGGMAVLRLLGLRLSQAAIEVDAGFADSAIRRERNRLAMRRAVHACSPTVAISKAA